MKLSMSSILSSRKRSKYHKLLKMFPKKSSTLMKKPTKKPLILMQNLWLCMKLHRFSTIPNRIVQWLNTINHWLRYQSLLTYRLLRGRKSCTSQGLVGSLGLHLFQIMQRQKLKATFKQWSKIGTSFNKSGLTVIANLACKVFLKSGIISRLEKTLMKGSRNQVKASATFSSKVKSTQLSDACVLWIHLKLKNSLKYW